MPVFLCECVLVGAKKLTNTATFRCSVWLFNLNLMVVKLKIAHSHVGRGLLGYLVKQKFLLFLKKKTRLEMMY